VYGSPWKHWFALLPNVQGPTTVFLTMAMIRMGGGGNVGNAFLDGIGLRFRRLECPSTLSARLFDWGVEPCLAAARSYGLAIVEAAEMPNPGGYARYIGVRLEKLRALCAPHPIRDAISDGKA
jgi:hypothetical protein